MSAHLTKPFIATHLTPLRTSVHPSRSYQSSIQTNIVSFLLKILLQFQATNHDPHLGCLLRRHLLLTKGEAFIIRRVTI